MAQFEQDRSGKYQSAVDTPRRNTDTPKTLTEMESLVRRTDELRKRANEINCRLITALDRIHGSRPSDIESEKTIHPVASNHISLIRDNLENLSRELTTINDSLVRLDTIG